MTNTSLCNALVTPDGCILTIKDAGAQSIPGTYVHHEMGTAIAAAAAQRALWVHTMNIHECDVVGRGVRVRVLTGTDRHGLGDLAFEGTDEYQ